MKKVLITGKDSYIGTHLKKYLEEYHNEYQVEELDVQSDGWENYDFTSYDVVFHVAGIAHIKESKDNEHLYFRVNRDLSYAIAKKAKREKVKQFIFMSSMSVYGMHYCNKPITKETLPKPNTYYGKSKYEAERLIQQLADDEFHICLVRPPMVYGPDSPGNLSKLFKLVRKIHIFPTIKNRRSAISVHVLVKQIQIYIDLKNNIINFPQNDEYMCTYQIVRDEMNREKVKVLYISFLNPLIKVLIGKVSLISKVFGDLMYEK